MTTCELSQSHLPVQCLWFYVGARGALSSTIDQFANVDLILGHGHRRRSIIESTLAKWLKLAVLAVPILGVSGTQILTMCRINVGSRLHILSQH